MKKNISIIIGFLTVFLIRFSDAQPCLRNITTDPNNPSNTFCDQILNDPAFDWQQYYFPVNPNFFMGESIITSPFFEGQNGFLSYLWNEVIYGPLDFQPADGWEILTYGFAPEVDELAYLILYNKYRSIIRVLTALPQTQFDYQYTAVNLIIEYQGTAQDKATAILNPVNGTSQPLDTETSVVGTSSTVNNPSVNLHFFHAEFPVEYDPCTCNLNNDLNLKVEFRKILNQELSAYGRLTEITQSLASLTDPNSGFVEDDFLTSVYNQETANSFETKAGGHTFKKYEDIVDYLDDLRQQKADYDRQYKGYKILNSLMKTGLEGILKGLKFKFERPLDVSIPFLGIKMDSTLKGEFSGKDLLGILGGSGNYFGANLKKKSDALGKKISTISNTTQFSHGEVAISGDLVLSVEDGRSFSFLVPGGGDYYNPYCISQWPGDYKDYPLYNEALGRFALLTTPELYINELDEFDLELEYDDPYGQGSIWVDVDRTNAFQMHLKSDLEYVFNPAAQIDEEATEMLAAFYIEALVVDAPGEYDLIGDGTMTLISQKGDSSLYSFMSYPIPIGCLTEVEANFGLKGKEYKAEWLPHDHYYDGSMEILNVALKLFVEYEFEDNLPGEAEPPAVFQIYTYPVSDLGPDPNGHPATFIDYPSFIEVDDVHFTSDTTVFAWSEIILTGNISVDPGVEVEIIAPSIVRTPGSRILDPSVWLHSNGSPFGCNEVPPLSSDLSNYCQNIYKGNIPASAIPQGNEKNKDKINRNKSKRFSPGISAIIYPNPVGVENATLAVHLSEPSPLSAQIFNIQGQRVKTIEIPQGELQEGTHLFTLGTSNIAPGTYIVRIITDKGIAAVKFSK